MSNSFPPPGDNPYAGPPPEGQPHYGTPQFGQAPQGQPQYGQPQYGAPQYGQPQYNQGYYTPEVMAPPASITRAVLLMRIGAGMALVQILVGLLTLGSARALAEEELSKQGTAVTTDLVNAAVWTGVIFAVIGGLIGAGLWIWMSVMNGKGRSWARILSSVFFGISVLGLLSTFTKPTPALNIAVTVLSVLIGAATIVLLWQKESSQFYEFHSRTH
ncbi:hypothetical protein KEM60_03186 [Austwickia sp. TVS 96-490-7B]|uniref:hypothetical protein n=1 Tax=Austwickia sp. TVS 96-490-7B TaxID=2830843 RepID=UPI001C586853|nr:hypothetical protein [Austwickia sp. TVS 96-490-7B]MBW3086957.1 hypothetical protein [Austwickia sp. TVS 96-490-7B]